MDYYSQFLRGKVVEIKNIRDSFEYGKKDR